MKKQKQFVFVVGMMLVILTIISLSGCMDEKSKFIGTWRTSDGDGTVTFNNDNKVTVTGQLGDLSLSGTYTWAVADGKITFTSESGGTVGITVDYRFPGDNQLVLTGSSGGSITLTKA
ncbi:MAG: hypothetical protein QCI00_07780 [Candidatus Thermoplasmatota archaeon]|nr:hypothetical protein [Candidatus Thermoplasmatota archaeon]